MGNRTRGAVVCFLGGLLVAWLAGVAEADKAEEDRTGAVLASALATLQKAPDAWKRWAEAGNVENLKQCVGHLRVAQDQLRTAIARMDAHLGPPVVAVEAVGKKWKQRRAYKDVLVRARGGQIVKQKQLRPSGGWQTIRVKVHANFMPKPALAMKLHLTIRGMEGHKEIHWTAPKKRIKQGDDTKTDLQIGVTEEEMPGFWIKDAELEQISKDVTVRVMWVRFEDGEWRGYR